LESSLVRSGLLQLRQSQWRLHLRAHSHWGHGEGIVARQPAQQQRFHFAVSFLALQTPDRVRSLLREQKLECYI
jgi:hypothetical protein